VEDAVHEVFEPLEAADAVTAVVLEEPAVVAWSRPPLLFTSASESPGG